MTTLRRELLSAAAPYRLLEAAGMTPDPWQRDITCPLPHRALLLSGRQLGKTSCLSVAGLHTAAYRPGAVVGIIAPTLRQSALLLRRLKAFLPFVPVLATNKAATTLELSNGSRIVAWPGNHPEAVRGDTLDLLLVDEGAWVSDDVFHAVLPMLSMSGGSMLAATTPGGPSGWFYDLWHDTADLDWVRVKVRAPDCPRYSRVELEKARRALGATAYAVEFLCEWRSASDVVFTSEEITRILGRPAAANDLGLDEETLAELAEIERNLLNTPGVAEQLTPTPPTPGTAGAAVSAAVPAATTGTDASRNGPVIDFNEVFAAGRTPEVAGL